MTATTAQSGWTARMITADHESAPLLLTTVEQAVGHGAVTSATLRATAHGVVEAYLNGRPATPDVLTPGWTTYEKRLRYAEWDVTGLLEPTSTLVLAVGNGWYRGRLGWLGLQRVYGAERAAAAELAITFADGHQQCVTTDESWRSLPSAILADDLYDGQTIDARLVLPSTAHLTAASELGPVRVVDFDPAVLQPYIAPPIRRQEERVPSLLGRTPDGGLLLDFGQNLVGWLRVRANGPAGHVIEARHAEVLEHGDLAMRALRSAKATDRFILSGHEDAFEPTFTIHGFRYARIDGWPGTDQEAVDSIRAIVVHTDLERTGWFNCSDPALQKLHDNVVWGLRGNVVGLPTDCPQRDERMGYVGDLAAFAPTATYLYEVRTFLLDWLRDLNAEQAIQNGAVPLTVPNTLKYETSMSAGYEVPPDFRPAPMAMWQDGAVWIPWALWEAYGDRTVLEQQRGSISAYLADVEASLDPDGLLTGGYQLGDWLDPAAPPDDPRAARADRAVLATACMYRTADLAARIASVLGDDEEAARRRALADRIRGGFLSAYVDGAGRIRSDAPAVYAVAITFGLLGGELKAYAGNRLAQLVSEGGYVIPTGFIGTPFVLHALSSTGHLDASYRLLTQTECPSWLYQVAMGASTIWERWDAMLPDGSVNPGEMTSFNHYAFGSVADWMHEVIAGISPTEPGYQAIRVQPRPGGGLTEATARLTTPHGDIRVEWHTDAATFTLGLVIPNGTRAEVVLPDGTVHNHTGASARTFQCHLDSNP